MDLSPVAKDEVPLNFSRTQLSVFWPPEEIKVEKCIQDVLVNMTPQEKHGVLTTLKLFTLYEVVAGEDYWATRFKKIFPSIEYIRMATTFSLFELNVHLPFYSKINELLHLHTDDFYDSYVADPTLKSRMDCINAIVNSDDDLISLGGFSMVEGVILYSSFAFLKHFQSQGKNKLMEVVRGINFSARDENIHAMAGAYCFKKRLEELNPPPTYREMLEEKLREIAQQLFEHESRIIDMIFEQGKMDGITAAQMKWFVKSRINLCLGQLGFKRLFDVKWNPIADWFYDSINKYTFNDFFSGQGREYRRDWDEESFTW